MEKVILIHLFFRNRLAAGLHVLQVRPKMGGLGASQRHG